MHNLASLAFFSTLSESLREHLQSTAQARHFPAKTVLFYEGESIAELVLVREGTIELTYGRTALGQATAGQILDPIASLGSLPHRMKATALTELNVWAWPLNDLWQIPEFSQAARQYLAQNLLETSQRQQALAAPIQSYDKQAQLQSGPFRFEDVSLIFAFCDANRAELERLLPPPLHLLQRPGRQHGTVLIALADFPLAYAEARPHAPFAYTETTFFIPVRYKHAWGLYTPYIYPSTWEPILLGREFYGFPKQLGHTLFKGKKLSLAVNGEPYLDLTWESSQPSSESRLIQTLSDSLGITGQLTGLMFQAGEILRKGFRLPAHRRVDVYNQRRILALQADSSAPPDDIHQLTRATFGILGWQQILTLHNTHLSIGGEVLGALDLVLRQAYQTKLTMRLGLAQVIQDLR